MKLLLLLRNSLDRIIIPARISSLTSTKRGILHGQIEALPSEFGLMDGKSVRGFLQNGIESKIDYSSKA